MASWASFLWWWCSSRLVRWLWTIWPIGSLPLCRQVRKTAFPLMAADGISVWAVLWTYRRPDVLVVVWIDGRIYWQSSWGLCWSCRRTRRPCLASCAAVCIIGRYQTAIDAMCLFDGPFVDGGLPIGSLVFHHQFWDLFVWIIERFVGGI